MSKKRELLKQIQQFLLCDCEDTYGFAKDIEELLTQPEQERDCPDYEDGEEFVGWEKRSGQQEPVAWMWEDARNENNSWSNVYCGFKPANSLHVKNVVPLYTSPQKQLQFLSDGEICLIYDTTEDSVSFARAIEKAYGIRG